MDVENMSQLLGEMMGQGMWAWELLKTPCISLKDGQNELGKTCIKIKEEKSEPVHHSQDRWGKTNIKIIQELHYQRVTKRGEGFGGCVMKLLKSLNAAETKLEKTKESPSV